MNDIQNDVSEIVLLVIMVAIASLSILLLGAINGLTFEATEQEINSITNEATVSRSVIEDFNSDSLNSDPSESWYIYTEVGWTYANVSYE